MDNDFERNYEKCRLCARNCGTDRTKSQMGFCKSSSDMHISRAALHMWEEPLISGEGGSGTVFFSGCSLDCVFCQNRAISGGECGVAVSCERLAEIMISLQNRGAHNINFVTPTHYAPSVARSTVLARERGLRIPTVYNTGSYDSRETILLLEGIIDIYMPDFKYFRRESGKKLSLAEDYPSVAKSAIAEMVRQQPKPVIEGGIMQRGVLVRILLLPGHLAEAKLSLKYLYEEYGNSIYISLMSQYTPMPGVMKPLDRRVSREEYRQLVKYAEKLGITQAFTQDYGVAEESFIPPFDNSGI